MRWKGKSPPKFGDIKRGRHFFLLPFKDERTNVWYWLESGIAVYKCNMLGEWDIIGVDSEEHESSITKF